MFKGNIQSDYYNEVKVRKFCQTRLLRGSSLVSLILFVIAAMIFGGQSTSLFLILVLVILMLIFFFLSISIEQKYSLNPKIFSQVITTFSPRLKSLYTHLMRIYRAIIFTYLCYGIGGVQILATYTIPFLNNNVRIGYVVYGVACLVIGFIQTVRTVIMFLQYLQVDKK